MRWFKHLTLAHAHEDLSEILEVGGAEAYGVWWLILEDIAALMDKGTSCPSSTHSLVKWAQICHCSVRAFRSITSRLAEKELIECQTTNERLRIVISKLVKYRDEYSKKSGQTHDSRAEKDKEVDTEREKRRDQNEFATAPNGFPKIEIGGPEQQQSIPTQKEIPVTPSVQEKLPIQTATQQVSNVVQMQAYQPRQISVMHGSMTASGSVVTGADAKNAPRRVLDAVLGLNRLCDPERDAWVNAAWNRHPKKRDLPTAFMLLEALWNDTESRELFDKRHPIQCQSRDWLKQGAYYCPKLGDWIRDEGYKQKLPGEDEPKPEMADGTDYPDVPELT